jgi:hypothetical protein
MTLRLNASTSGYTEIDAPAVAGNNSIALPAGNGSAFQVVRNGATAGSLEFADKIVSGTAQNSTFGTAIDFTGIPSWVKRVTVMFNGVSTNGTSNTLVRLGTSGGIATSGYLSGTGFVWTSANTCQAYTDTTGFLSCVSLTAAGVFSGAFVLTNLLSNAWVAAGTLYRSDVGQVFMASGSVTLSGTLDRVRITTVNGTDTFDAGSINILYE